ncbi:hypothetical protein PIB30_097215, partial [Stylosanthes scabra]|nr:hypothetical protein [Stylosanthes scabra]
MGMCMGREVALARWWRDKGGVSRFGLEEPKAQNVTWDWVKEGLSQFFSVKKQNRVPLLPILISQSLYIHIKLPANSGNYKEKKLGAKHNLKKEEELKNQGNFKARYRYPAT